MAKRKHKKITPADEPEPGTRRSPRRAQPAGQRAPGGAAAGQRAPGGAAPPPAHAPPPEPAPGNHRSATRRRAPTTPAPRPTAPLQSPVEAAGDMKRLAKARAGLMSPEERQDLYGLVAATMEALTRDEQTKQRRADDRASDAHADDCVADDGTLHSGAVLHVGLVRQARRLVLLLGRLMRRRRGR